MLLNLVKQYRDYLRRYAENCSFKEAPAFTYDEFCTAFAVWVRDYHQAWTNNDTTRMARLEHMLQL